MKKVIVIGCPGSGKSTFARSLHKKTGLPLYYIDMLYWNSDKTTVERPVLIERLQRIINTDAWIIDGNYVGTMEMRLAACDTAFFLDYPTEVCLAGVAARRGKPRSDMPWIEEAEDPEFTDYIKNFNADYRPAMLDLLVKYPAVRQIVFRTRAEADAYLQK